MEPIQPFWFKQRQCKAEPAGDLWKVSGPNLVEAYLGVAPGEGGAWKATLRAAADGPVLVESEHASAKEAWEAAFEMYRTRVIV